MGGEIHEIRGGGALQEINNCYKWSRSGPAEPGGGARGRGGSDNYYYKLSMQYTYACNTYKQALRDHPFVLLLLCSISASSYGDLIVCLTKGLRTPKYICLC